VVSVTVDGQVQSDWTVHLVDDHKEHFVEIDHGVSRNGEPRNTNLNEEMV
jgi:hypothetical protein